MISISGRYQFVLLSIAATLSSAQFAPSRSVCAFYTPSGSPTTKSTHLFASDKMKPFISETDVKRSEFCSEHFGECSVEEMEKLRDSK